MKKTLLVAVRFTLVTTVLCGLLYPLVVTGLAHLLFPRRASGQMIERDGKVIGSRIIGQEFSGPAYFHSRPSAAGTGYDPLDSGGSNLGPTNRALIERVEADARKLHAENPDAAIPSDLVTASGSGLDPDISPAGALFQAPMVARTRGVSEQAIVELIHRHTRGRQFGFLGEPRVNVLELNLALDRRYPLGAKVKASSSAAPRGRERGVRNDSRSTAQ